MVTNCVGDDRKQPWGDRERGIVGSGGPMNANEYFLEEVVSIGVGHTAAHQIGVDRSAVGLD